jgi:hypothetical protein
MEKGSSEIISELDEVYAICSKEGMDVVYFIIDEKSYNRILEHLRNVFGMSEDEIPKELSMPFPNCDKVYIKKVESKFHLVIPMGV